MQFEFKTPRRSRFDLRTALALIALAFTALAAVSAFAGAPRPIGAAIRFLLGGTDQQVASVNFSTGLSGSVTGGVLSVTAAGGGGSGDVVGPASAVDNQLTRYDSTTGKLVQACEVTCGDTGSLVLGASDTVDGRDVSVDGTKLDGLPTSAYATVGDDGSSQTQRGRLNLISGNSFTLVCADNSGSNSSDCTHNVTTTPASQTAVGATRLLTMGSGLLCGGAATCDFSADRTITSPAWTSQVTSSITTSNASSAATFSITVPDETVTLIDFTCIGVIQGTGDEGRYARTWMLRANGGTLTTVSSVSNPSTDYESAGFGAANGPAAPTISSLTWTNNVQGIAVTTINWLCSGVVRQLSGA